MTLSDVKGVVPVRPAVPQAKAIEPGHQIELGRPDVAVGRGVADEAAPDLHPVMRPRHLPDNVVEGFYADVVSFEGEDPAKRTWGDASQLGDDHLDHKATTWLEVSGGVGKNCDLFVLRGDVHDGVRHQVHEPEGPTDPCGRHVADGHRKGIGARLGPQLFHHVRGQLDPLYRGPSGAQRQRHPSGTDCELEHGAAS